MLKENNINKAIFINKKKESNHRRNVIFPIVSSNRKLYFIMPLVFGHSSQSQKYLEMGDTGV